MVLRQINYTILYFHSMLHTIYHLAVVRDRELFGEEKLSRDDAFVFMHVCASIHSHLVFRNEILQRETEIS